MLDNCFPRGFCAAVVLAACLVGGAAGSANAEATGRALRGLDCNANGVADDVDISAGTSEDCNSNGVPDECDVAGPVVYVDADATGADTGANWTDALTDLQMALCMAAQPALGITEIRVAAGTYRPAGSNGLRTATFQLLDGVALYGGYAGAGHPDPNHRHPKVHETILSGDLAGDDVGTNGREENSYHVVTASGTAATALLDGFTVARGNADGIGSDANGGGIYAASGAATIRNCHITSNGAANEGGGVYGSTGQISKCRVSANWAYKGAGLYNCAHISHSYIVRNGVWLDSANDTYTGGGLGACNQVYNSVISGNAAQYGGGLHQCQSIVNCTIAGNEAQVGSGVELKAGSIIDNNIIWYDSLTGPLRSASEIYRNILPFAFVEGAWNINADPQFVDPTGPDAIFGTDDDALGLIGTSPAIDAGYSGTVPVDFADVDNDGDVTERIPLDLDATARFVDDPHIPNTGQSFPGYPPVDIGAFEYKDCNDNGANDILDIQLATSTDCNSNNVPDECENDLLQDCNNNTVLDACDISYGTSSDCNHNLIPDECESDCNQNTVPDDCDLSSGVSLDCNSNNIPDECEIAVGSSEDCNTNSIPDMCEMQHVGSIEQDTILIRDDEAVGDQFGHSVSISGSGALVGAPFDSDAGTSTGSAYVFGRAGGAWEVEAKLIASDATAADTFGRSVSISGNTVLIGANMDDDNGFNSGSAYVFRKTGGAWVEIAKLAASDAASQDQFGYSVAVGDTTAIIGAPFDDDRGSDSGSAYIFRQVAGVWQQIAKLTASDGAADDRFGSSVAIDGTRIVVGAFQDDNFGTSSGSAYVFEEVGGVWQQRARLNASDAASQDLFGFSVSIVGDSVLVGAYGDDDGGSAAGSAYLFQVMNGVWQQRTKLNAGDPVPGNRFGYSVALGNGIVCIGGEGDDGLGSDSGSAYLFREINGMWLEVSKLTASDALADDRFGAGVSISGYSILIGAPSKNAAGPSSGSGYVFVDSLLASVDCNVNGVLDECELADSDCNANSVPDDCDPDLDGDAIPDDCDPCAAGQASGDADGDGDVSLADYLNMEGCLLGILPSVGPGCECFDFDASGTVDLLDFAELQVEFTIEGGG